MHRRTFLFGSAALTLVPHLARANPEEAFRVIQGQVDSGELGGAVLHVTHRGRTISRAFGSCTDRSVFYLASLTKPMVATAIMQLVDRGAIALHDRANRYIPELTGGERDAVTIKHLVTHTSGLPDMLPENDELRTRHAPLSEFVARACRTPLLYSPGTQCRYQSMGILLAGEIVARVTGSPLADVLQRDVFAPLGMRDSSLGLGGRRLEDTVQLQRDEPTDWAQNSPYWRNLLAPWADVHATAADVARFANYFLHPDPRVVKPETAATMLVNQNDGLNTAWGIGWSFGRYGSGASPRAVGHGGSSGTSMWIDPVHDLSCVLLTSLPSRFSTRTVITPVNEAISLMR